MEAKKIPIHSDAVPEAAGESAEFRVVDKRHFTEAASGAVTSGAVEEKPRYPSFVEELIERTARTEKRYAEKVKEINEELSRTKSRLEAEHERRLAASKADLLLPFLEVLDNLERAMTAAKDEGACADLLEGLELTAALFRSRLKTHAVEPLEVVRLPFDPNVSQAVGVVAVADPNEDGLVIEEVLRGYRMAETVIRPAQVRVGRHIAEPVGSGSER
jgi:molecular chaperone GrpE (heat shock protein)